MINDKLIEKANKVIRSYSGIPESELVQQSFVDEIANEIVDWIILEGIDFFDFDFKDFFSKTNIK